MTNTTAPPATPCRLAEIDVRRMGRLQHVQIPLDDELTLIHGRAARGKTTLLRAAAVAMSRGGAAGHWYDLSSSHQRHDEEAPEVVARSVAGSHWTTRLGSSIVGEYKDTAVPTLARFNAHSPPRRATMLALQKSTLLKFALGRAFDVLHPPGRTRIEKNPARWSTAENAVASLFLEIAILLQATYGPTPDALTKPAFAAVDDIDAYLHPGAQQLIAPKLRRVFPGVQLLASTHSPQVLTTARPEQIIELADSRQSP